MVQFPICISGITMLAQELKGMAHDTEATLNSLPQGTQLVPSAATPSFRVLAVNKAGESEPSNTVAAVL